MPYMCIFNSDKECPVRKEYKLKPESLVPFCKLCFSHTSEKELDIRLEDMKETHDIDMARLEFEKQKWEWEKNREGETIDRVKDLIITVTRSAEQVSSITQPNTYIEIKCPNCSAIFPTRGILDKIYCIHCGAKLERTALPRTEDKPHPNSKPKSEEDKKTKKDKK